MFTRQTVKNHVIISLQSQFAAHRHKLTAHQFSLPPVKKSLTLIFLKRSVEFRAYDLPLENGQFCVWRL